WHDEDINSVGALMTRLSSDASALEGTRPTLLKGSDILSTQSRVAIKTNSSAT
ncbi:unnamed protein product, partial [Didymodactylos carnosus]